MKHLFEGKTIKDKKVNGCYVCGFEEGKEIHTIVNQTEKQKQKGEFSSHLINPKSVQYIRDKNKTKEFMLQQLLGYRLGKEGYSITELITGAGLTKKEWFEIKHDTECKSLSESDKSEIEDYVNRVS